MITSCSSIIPFDEAQFNRLVETCAKRVDKLKLAVHIDFDELYDMKKDIGDEMRRNNSEIVRLAEMLPEVKDFTAFNEPSGYFSEEGGALDFNSFDDDLDEYDDGDGFDNYDEYVHYDDFEWKDLRTDQILSHWETTQIELNKFVVWNNFSSEYDFL